MSEQLNIENYTTSSDEGFWSYFVDQKVVVIGATPYTDTDDQGQPVPGVKVELRDPVERNGSKYTVLKTTWSVVVKTLLASNLQEKFAEGAELPVVAKKAPGKRYYILAKP